MKFIHVNQHIIRSNLKYHKNDPVITIKEGTKNTYCYEAEILGPSKIIYSNNEKPILDCGARVVLMTDSDIKIIR